MKLYWAATALLVAGLAAGCATNGQESGPDPLAAQDAAPVTTGSLLHVNNRNWRDVDVYAVRHGTRLRLGTVAAMASGDYKVPMAIMAGGDFEFLVAPVGETNGYTTQSVFLEAGQTVDLQVENNLSLSTFSIY